MKHAMPTIRTSWFMILKNHEKYLSSAVLCVLACSGACAQNPLLHLRKLNVQGEVYASACTPQNKMALRSQLTLDAWTLVETLLCEKKSASSAAYVASHIGKTVQYATSSTGSPDETEKAVVNAELIDSLLSEGAAWNADLTASKNKIVVKFMADEACVRSRTFQLSKSIWEITGLGEACD